VLVAVLVSTPAEKRRGPTPPRLVTAGLNWHGVQLSLDPLPASPETREEFFLQVLLALDIEKLSPMIKFMGK